MSQLKEKLLSSFIAFEEQKNVDSYVHGIRTKSIKKFEKEGFPTKKMENWKYTSLKKVLDYDYKLFPTCLLYTSPSPRDRQKSRMPSSA